MKKLIAALQKAADWLDADDDPKEASFDPVHIGETLIVAMVVVGALYWILWTLLVYEGGLFMKLAALLRGERGPAAYEGWAGNAAALAAAAALLAGLHRLYHDGERRAKTK